MTAIFCIRVKYIDPDFRPRPKTKHYCCVCYRDIKPGSGHRIVYLMDSGINVLHPTQWQDYKPNGDDDGLSPIGLDCARKIGMEWSKPT